VEKGVTSPVVEKSLKIKISKLSNEGMEFLGMGQTPDDKFLEFPICSAFEISIRARHGKRII
jgi:hypothetical protein